MRTSASRARASETIAAPVCCGVVRRGAVWRSVVQRQGETWGLIARIDNNKTPPRGKTCHCTNLGRMSQSHITSVVEQSGRGRVVALRRQTREVSRSNPASGFRTNFTSPQFQSISYDVDGVLRLCRPLRFTIAPLLVVWCESCAVFVDHRSSSWQLG